MTLEAGSILGRFRIVGELGSGGMGQVFVAEDRDLKRRVALKVLPEDLARDPDRRRRFEREAEIIASLDHPGIVQVYSIEEIEGVTFLTMRLVEGETLLARRSETGMGADEFLKVAIPLVDAVEAAHRKGITHRDLKPSNVMVTRDGRVKVLDFGLAKFRATGEPSEDGRTEATELDLTREGAIVGTARYMSPEQAEGREIDPRSDIFSLGILFAEMLTGAPPFHGDTKMAVISSILKDEPTDVTAVRRELPRTLGHIVQRCLEKDREKRYQSAEDVKRALEELAVEIQSGEVERGPGPPEREPMAAAGGGGGLLRFWPVAAAVGLIGVALVVGWRAGWFPAQREGSRTATAVLALPTEVPADLRLDYLTDAIPRSLTARLARSRSLDVKLPPTTVEVGRVGGDLGELAQVYSADVLVTSAVRQEGETLALKVGLLEPPSWETVWDDELRGPAEAPLAVVRQAAERVRRVLSPGEGETTSVVGASWSSPAEMEFRKGQYLGNRYANLAEPGDFDEALAACERALELDPKLAEAAAEIANLYVARWKSGDRTALVEAERWARRALALDPRSADAWGALSYVEGRRAEVDPRARLEAALKAATFGPRDTRGQEYLAAALDELTLSSTLSSRAYAEAVRLDPLNLRPRLGQAGVLMELGRPGEAALLVDRVLELQPDLPLALVMKAWALSALGHVQEAEELATRIFELIESQRLSPESFMLAPAIIALDRKDDATLEPILQGVRELAANPGAPLWMKRFGLGLGVELARHEEVERALDFLELYARNGLVLSYDALVLSPVFDSLRGEERFQAILNQSRQVFESTVGTLSDARRRKELPRYLDEPLDELLRQLELAPPG